MIAVNVLVGSPESGYIGEIIKRRCYLLIFFFVTFIQNSISSGSLQLADATGSIDTVIPNLPSSWSIGTLYEVDVTFFKIICYEILLFLLAAVHYV